MTLQPSTIDDYIEGWIMNEELREIKKLKNKRAALTAQLARLEKRTFEYRCVKRELDSIEVELFRRRK